SISAWDSAVRWHSNSRLSLVTLWSGTSARAGATARGIVSASAHARRTGVSTNFAAVMIETPTLYPPDRRAEYPFTSRAPFKVVKKKALSSGKRRKYGNNKATDRGKDRTAKTPSRPRIAQGRASAHATRGQG